MTNWGTLANTFSEWSPKTVGRDFLVNFVAGIVTSIVVVLVARRWPLIRSFLVRDAAAFRRLFGSCAIRDGYLYITLDVYQNISLLPHELQDQLRRSAAPAPRGGAAGAAAEPPVPRIAGQLGAPPASGARVNREGPDAPARASEGNEAPAGSPVHPQGVGGTLYFKLFPNGHFTGFPGASEGVLGYCSARGAGYVIDALSRVPSVGIKVRTVADREVAGLWDATFINLGSSYSNIKTDDIKHMHDRTLFRDDDMQFTVEGYPPQQEEARSRKGIIAKRGNPYFPGHALLVCAGLGEWGTSGAAWYLAKNWKDLSRRFRSRDFVIVVSVLPEADESARELLFEGDESLIYRVRRGVRVFSSRIAGWFRRRRPSWG